MNTLRALTFMVLTLFGTIANASSTGIWSGNAGYYLVLMEQSSTGAMAALSISPSLQSGTAFTGSRSGDIITLRSLDQASSIDITLSGQTYTGTYTTAGLAQALSGKLILAYAGSANDGIWQKNDGSTRYLSTLTVISNAAQLMVLVDLTIPASGSALTYDVSTGIVQPISNYPTFVGKSLVSGNTVSLSFRGGSPATGSYKIVTTTKPLTTLEQFDVNRIFSID